jgi:choline dehydrogenase-like flavoprotein
MILQHPPTSNQSCDICIVGSGPIGMALALEFERLGRDVLVLESGDATVDPSATDASRAELASTHTHAPMERAVCRALGGTSWTWGGRCVPFDDIDFQERPFVPNSSWPIGHDEITPWYGKAAEYLLCGDDTFQLPDPCKLGDDVTAAFIERWSTQPRLMLVHLEHIRQSKRITVCLNSTVVDLDLGADGSAAERVLGAAPTGRFSVTAREVVLAGGGVETTRLLLAVQRRWPNRFGGIDGPLGRYYMGHISGKIASIAFTDPDRIRDFDFAIDSTGAYIRRRFVLTRSAQMRYGVLNTAFWPDNPPFYDYRHRNAVLSAVFLALAIPPVGRRLLPEAIRLAHVGSPPYHVGSHLINLLSGAPTSVTHMVKILRERVFGKPRKPGFLVRNRGGKYALHYHAEQEPHPDSRIVLTRETDRYGLLRVRIDFRFTGFDAQSVVTSHEVLDSALRKSGMGSLDYWYPQNDLQRAVLAQASDGFHQAGTTRMGNDPNQSVVDKDLNVHGISNLHVASTSVLPTTGQANSTLIGTALAMRLAHHLDSSAVRHKRECLQCAL